MTNVSVHNVVEILEQTGQEVVLPGFGKLRPEDVTTKSGPGDLVTTLDVATEKFVTPRLLALVPGSHVAGEEATGLGPVPKVFELSWSFPTWTFDPLDGTSLLAESLKHSRSMDPRVASMASLVDKGEVVLSVIHFPVSGMTIAAEKGAGAFIGTRKLGVLEPADGDLITGILTMPGPSSTHRRTLLRAQHPEFFSKLYPPSNAASEYASLVTPFQAEGLLPIRPQNHFFLRLYGSKDFKPWDHIPGRLIVKEAGGEVKALSGNGVDIDDPREGVLVAAPRLWNRMYAGLRDNPLVAG